LYVVAAARDLREAEELAAELRDFVGELWRHRQTGRHPLCRQPAEDPFRKIMRRLLRSIARDEEITDDISTLENPAIVEQLRGRA
jgi:acetyl-CoA synthetase